MSNAGSTPHIAVGNGSTTNGRQPTPADMVGNQFVSQFYTVLHSSPRYLHRFYTDDSTVTHADCGIDGEPPSTVTVAGQKGISERVMAMGFEEAVTEIWSVDSQYSQNSGVVVMVTGSLQCKGKKKRDFVQSFFLAVQEKGYFVLNDTFRYLSDRASRPNQYPKENGYVTSNYEKAYGQMGGYHQNQHSYYPNQVPAHSPHHAVSSMYTTQTAANSFPAASPAPIVQQSAVQQSRADVTRGHTVTPSMQPTRAAAPAPPKPTVAPAALPPQAQPSTAAPITHSPVSSQVPTAPPAKQSAPVHTPAPQGVPETTRNAPPPSAASTQAPTAPKVEAPAEPSAPTTEPASQPVTSSKTEAKDRKPETVSKPAEAPPKESEPAEPAAPAAPLSYADKLKLGARAPVNVPAAAAPPAPAATPKPASAAPKAVQQPAKAVEPEEPAGLSEAPEASNSTANGNVSVLPEENLTTSIFVRDLPDGISAEKIEEAFSRFGPIKGGVQGVNLKQQKGKEDFAFVEFEEAAAMQAAIEGEVVIDGKTATVMERRPQFPRNLRGPGYQRPERSGRGGEGRGFRGGPGRGERGRGRNDSSRPYPSGRGDNPRTDSRTEGHSGRGRSFSGQFSGESRNEGRGRGERGRGPREGGRGDRGRAPHTVQPARVQA